MMKIGSDPTRHGFENFLPRTHIITSQLAASTDAAQIVVLIANGVRRYVFMVVTWNRECNMDDTKPKEVTVTLKKSTIGRVAIAFLILTALPIGTEVFFAVDGKESTPTWTEMISDHIPWELALFVYAGLAVWVPIHFYRNYRSRRNRT